MYSHQRQVAFFVVTFACTKEIETRMPIKIKRSEEKVNEKLIQRTVDN